MRWMLTILFVLALSGCEVSPSMRERFSELSTGILLASEATAEKAANGAISSWENGQALHTEDWTRFLIEGAVVGLAGIFGVRERGKRKAVEKKLNGA